MRLITKPSLFLLVLPLAITQLHGQQSISAQALDDIYKGVSFYANWGNARIIGPTGSIQSIAMDTTIEYKTRFYILKTAPFTVAVLDAHASLDYSLSLRSMLTREELESKLERLENICYPFPSEAHCWVRLELVDARTGARVGEQQNLRMGIATDQEGANDTTLAGSVDFTIPQEVQGRLLQMKATVFASRLSLSTSRNGESFQWLHKRVSMESMELFSGDMSVDPTGVHRLGEAERCESSKHSFALPGLCCREVRVPQGLRPGERLAPLVCTS